MPQRNCSMSCLCYFIFLHIEYPSPVNDWGTHNQTKSQHKVSVKISRENSKNARQCCRVVGYQFGSKNTLLGKHSKIKTTKIWKYITLDNFFMIVSMWGVVSTNILKAFLKDFFISTLFFLHHEFQPCLRSM